MGAKVTANNVSIDNPEIQKHLVINVQHIDARDRILLEKANEESCFVSVDEYQFGWRVYVAEEGQNDEETLTKEGYSKEFIRIYLLTRQHGCLFVDFDQDGLCYPGLKIFNW